MRVEAGYAPRSFLMARALAGRHWRTSSVARDAPCYVVTEAARRGGHRLPRAPRGAGLARAAAPARRWTRCWRGARTVLVLEDVVDHTNVGAILRSGAALGVDAALLSPRCADPLYRRSVKVAMGAVFIAALDPARRLGRGALPACPSAGFTTVALTLAAGCGPAGGRRPGLDRVALVLGTEGHGLSRRWQRARTVAPSSRWRAGRRLAQRGGRRPPWPATWPAPRARPRSGTAPASRRVVLGGLLVGLLEPLACRSASRSPNTVPRVWSVSCCRHRASSPSPEKVTGAPVQVRSRSPWPGRAARTRRTLRGTTGTPPPPPSSARSLPSGSITTGLQTTPGRPGCRTRRDSRTRRPPGPRRSGRPRGRRRRRRTWWPPCRRPGRAVRRRTSVTGRCGRCMTGSPHRVIGRTEPPGGSEAGVGDTRES